MSQNDPQDDTTSRQDNVRQGRDKTRKDKARQDTTGQDRARQDKRREENRGKREDKDKDKDKAKTKTDKDTTKRRPDKYKTQMTKKRQHKIRKTTEQELHEADE